jgi:hypothetical protein
MVRDVDQVVFVALHWQLGSDSLTGTSAAKNGVKYYYALLVRNLKQNLSDAYD